jgi:hypothetical protein
MAWQALYAMTERDLAAVRQKLAEADQLRRRAEAAFAEAKSMLEVLEWDVAAREGRIVLNGEARR